MKTEQEIRERIKILDKKIRMLKVVSDLKRFIQGQKNALQWVLDEIEE